MKKVLLIFICALFASKSAFSVNRRMMEDKTMVGLNASYVLPMGAYADNVNGAIGAGFKGKYFGTNTFAFGFDVGFFFPKIKTERLTFVSDSVLRKGLLNEQRLNKIHDSVQITNVVGTSQYIPINLSFEFYLPSRSLTNFRPYAAIGVGLNMINQRYETSYNVQKLPSSGIPDFEERVQPSTNKGYISLSPSIGFLWTLNELWNINMEARYSHFFGDQKGGAVSLHFGVIWDLSFKYVR